MSTPNIDSRVRTADGRTVTYAEYGLSDGRPVVWLHGLPGSRRDLSIGKGPGIVSEIGLRVLAPDRPGFGGSSPHARRSHSSFATDVRDLADACGVDRFAVLGYSGGAGYALACAALLQDRVDAVGIVSGAGPSSTPGWTKGMWRTDKVMLPLSRWTPALARTAMRSAAKQARKHPEKFLQTLRKDVAGSPHDVAVLQDNDAVERVLTAFTEATEQGPDGCVSDWAVWARPWDFDIRSAAGRPVWLWHGDQDPVIPLRHAQHLQTLLPGANLCVWQNEGHFHDDDHWYEVLNQMLNAKSGPPS